MGTLGALHSSFSTSCSENCHFGESEELFVLVETVEPLGTWSYFRSRPASHNVVECLSFLNTTNSIMLTGLTRVRVSAATYK